MFRQLLFVWLLIVCTNCFGAENVSEEFAQMCYNTAIPLTEEYKTVIKMGDLYQEKLAAYKKKLPTISEDENFVQMLELESYYRSYQNQAKDMNKKITQFNEKCTEIQIDIEVVDRLCSSPEPNLWCLAFVFVTPK